MRSAALNRVPSGRAETWSNEGRNAEVSRAVTAKGMVETTPTMVTSLVHTRVALSKTIRYRRRVESDVAE